MSEILCVTNRTLCKEDFLSRIQQIAEAHPKGIILREKDLSEASYKSLACRVLAICQASGTPCILHNFVTVAEELNYPALHLPLDALRSLSQKQRNSFSVLGASCHSVEDAIEAEKLGCTYITAGHVFDTDCKKGLPGRGLAFLQNVCKSVSIPVYAIGGISAANFKDMKKSGAFGACVMSEAMQCEHVQTYLHNLLHFTPTSVFTNKS